MPSPLRAPTRQRPLRPRLGTRFLRPAAGPTGFGTIVPRTATVAQTASGTSITGTLPTDRQPGDYVIAHFGMTCTPAQFTRPSAGDGWVQLIAPTDNGSSETVAVYGMFTPTVAPTGSSSAAANRQTCIMQAYGVVDPTTPIDVTGTVTTGLLPLTVAEVTTVTPGARLISGSIGDFSTGTWNTPAGMTIVGTHTSGTGRGAALADELRVSAGATGTRQWSASVSALNSAGYHLALRPAPVPVVREYLAGEASAVNISVTTAANTQAGDLILAFHSNDFNTAANVTPPTTGTWVLKATGDNGTDASHVKVWSSSAAGGAQTITVAPTVSGEEHALHVVVFAGACTTDAAAGGNGTATASHVSPTVSPAGAADMLFTLATSNGAVAGNYTAPAGMTERTELDDSTFAFTASLADQYLAGSGTTGTRTWTYSSSSGGYATVSVAVQAPAAGGGTVNGTASIAGAGTVSAVATQGAGSSPAGAGSLTANVTQGAGAALAGAGTLSAAGAITGTATIAGTGTLTAASAGATQGTATIAGAGTVTAVVTQGVTASPAGAGAVSATVWQGSGANPTGGGLLSASVVQQATASIAGAGTLTANAGGSATGTASPAGAGVLTANAVQIVTAAINGAGTVSANVVQQAGASPAGAGALTAAVVQRVTATLTGAGTLAANAQGTSSGTASLVGAGTVSAVATVTLRAGAILTGAGVVTATGAIAGAATFTGAGALTASVRQQATAAVTGAGTLVATAGFTLNATAVITGAGTVVATGRTKWTFRPNTGTTVRPNTGITGRPFTGVTPRP